MRFIEKGVCGAVSFTDKNSTETRLGHLTNGNRENALKTGLKVFLDRELGNCKILKMSVVEKGVCGAISPVLKNRTAIKPCDLSQGRLIGSVGLFQAHKGKKEPKINSGQSSIVAPELRY